MKLKKEDFIYLPKNRENIRPQDAEEDFQDEEFFQSHQRKSRQVVRFEDEIPK